MKTTLIPPCRAAMRETILRRGIPCLAALMLATGTSAQTEDNDAAEAVARIVTQDADPANCISRVAVRTINGQNKFVSPQGFNLKPGKYTLSGTVALDTRYCKVPPGNSYRSVPPLEAEFEAGKTYYIGFDHGSPNREDWAYVVWKVE